MTRYVMAYPGAEPKELLSTVEIASNIPPDPRMNIGDFIRSNDIKTVLELGTGSGSSAYWCALAGAKVTTVETLWVSNRCQGFVEEVWKGNITLVLCSPDFPPVPTDRKFDFVFIDTSHILAQTEIDVAFAKQYSPKWIGFDDESTAGVSPVIGKLCDEWKASKMGIGWDIVAVKAP